MQPDTAPSPTASSSLLARIPDAWRATLISLLVASALIMGVAAREWGEMFHQWWHIDTYTHILLVPVIIGWLVVLKAEELAKVAPKAWLPGLAVVGAGLALWLAGRATDINLIAHAGAVGALQGVVIAIIGPRASLMLALPLVFGVFLVPFGDEIIPPLQAITAEIAIALTHWSGIPAEVDGIYIDTPVGLFIVAEACSGVRFLIAMVTLAVLVCFTRFQSWSRRAAFMATSIIVPIIANGIRAWGTIYIAQSQGVEFAAGFDHIFYGWIFFAVVVALILSAAWRFFECEPEDFGWTQEEVSKLKVAPVLERDFASPIVLVAGTAALAISASLIAPIVAAPALG